MRKTFLILFCGGIFTLKPVFSTQLSPPLFIKINKGIQHIKTDYSKLQRLYFQIRSDHVCLSNLLDCEKYKIFSEESSSLMKSIQNLKKFVKAFIGNPNQKISIGGRLLSLEDIRFIEAQCNNYLKEYQNIYQKWISIKNWNPQEAQKYKQQVDKLDAKLSDCRKLSIELKQAKENLTFNADPFNLYINLVSYEASIRYMNKNLITLAFRNFSLDPISIVPKGDTTPSTTETISSNTPHPPSYYGSGFKF